MITFEREARTPHSEIFTIWEEGSIIGRIDLHYGGQGGQVHATICTVGDATEEQIQALIDSADERLVMTADPFREDFIVTVWKGTYAGTYTDSEDEEDDEDAFHLGNN